MRNSTDVLLIEEEDVPKPKTKVGPKFKGKMVSKKKVEAEESESSDDSYDSLSTDTDESNADDGIKEDHGEDHNLTAVKPVSGIGVEVTDEKQKNRERVWFLIILSVDT